MRVDLRGHGLHTVCEEASCPNLGECWRAGTATFMILGDICTRNCRFCNVEEGEPRGIDPDEGERLADMVEHLKLNHVVITSVARDDLCDLGASHFVDCIQKVRGLCPKTKIEVLTTDFSLIDSAIDRVLFEGKPDVFNHNLETVRRLTDRVRHRATYDNSLRFLAYLKGRRPGQVTKSGFMLGLGEGKKEVIETLEDLHAVGCEIVTIGQYLRPSLQHLPVEEYIAPESFKEYEDMAYSIGFRCVASGPFVRSSYRAKEMVRQ